MTKEPVKTMTDYLDILIQQKRGIRLMNFFEHIPKEIIKICKQINWKIGEEDDL